MRSCASRDRRAGRGRRRRSAGDRACALCPRVGGLASEPRRGAAQSAAHRRRVATRRRETCSCARCRRRPRDRRRGRRARAPAANSDSSSHGVAGPRDALRRVDVGGHRAVEQKVAPGRRGDEGAVDHELTGPRARRASYGPRFPVSVENLAQRAPECALAPVPRPFSVQTVSEIVHAMHISEPHSAHLWRSWRSMRATLLQSARTVVHNSSICTRCPPRAFPLQRDRKDRPRTMGSAALSEAIKSIRDWSLTDGRVSTTSTEKATDVFGSPRVQRQGAAGAFAEAGVPRAARDDHARRAARCWRRPMPWRRR